MRWLKAPAKVNLSLRVVGRRPDGLHDIESLVAFADVCDWLGFEPAPGFELIVEGPRAREAGPLATNLVSRAAETLAARVANLRLGKFRLVKHLPAAAGLGGGSSDAAAALRALADANELSTQDERFRAAALETGADVPVCLFPSARVMTGIGEVVGPELRLPELFAVLANPGVAAPTKPVFEALGLAKGALRESSSLPLAAAPDAVLDLDSLLPLPNHLQSAAVSVAPAIETTLQALAGLPGVRAARMSGSGATCFALFAGRREAAAAASRIAATHQDWWVRAVTLR